MEEHVRQRPVSESRVRVVMLVGFRSTRSHSLGTMIWVTYSLCGCRGAGSSGRIA